MAARAKDKIIAASSFTDKKTAIKAVKENLRSNARNIVDWLLDSTADIKTNFDFIHKHSIGKTVPQNKMSPTYNVTVSRIVLKKDPNLPLGFKIITAFPND